MERIKIGSVADISPGRAKSYRAQGKDLIVVNTGDGLRGYVNFCQHMGGKLRCVGEHFECDWHGARYECKTGIAVPGYGGAPEGAELEKIEIEIDGQDIIWLYAPKKSMWALE
jgi:3-phenylpropionate/trans-cinnamate dioxygenase ferredoxin subunit